MDRRRFITESLIAGSIGVYGCSQAEQQQKQAEAKPAATPAAAPFELEEATIATLQDGMKSGKYTARSTKNKLDAIIAPANGPAWTTDHLNGDHFAGGSSTAAAIAGYPNITVPCGYVGGLPIGISFFGRAWSEPILIKVAFAYEQATRHRRPPKFLPNSDATAT